MAKKQRIDIAHGKRFFDGLDSYGDEVLKWTKREVVRGLVGIYELPEPEFSSGTVDEHLSAVGCPFPRVEFNSTMEHIPTGSPLVTGTGYTTAVRDQYGRIQPVIIFRTEVDSDVGELDAEVRHLVRLTVIMHELGHAEDIAKAVNYNHATLALDMVQTEVYAHEFVCRHAKKMNYRYLLGHYIENLDHWIATGSDVQRLSAEIAVQKMDMAALKQFAVPEVNLGEAAFMNLMNRHDRMDDFRKKKAKDVARR